MPTSSLAVICVATLLMTLPSAGSAAEVVVPDGLANVRGNINNTSPWNCGSAPSQRYQQVYRGTEVGSGIITEIAFRPNSGPFSFTLQGVTITLSSTSNGPDGLSTTFADNVGPDVTTVFSGALTLSSAGDFGAQGDPPPPFDVVIPLQHSFTFNAGTGLHLLIDVNIPVCANNGAVFNAQFVLADSVSRVFDFGSALPGIVAHDTVGLVTKFTIEPAPPPPPTTLVAAVLPSSRSVQVGTKATAFATIINSGPNTAFGVGIALGSPILATFTFNQTNCLTNVVIGSDNVLVNIAAGGQACYVISIAPTAPLAPTEVTFTFAGTNTAPVATIIAVNTLLMSASSTPVPDMVALAATLTNDGILHIPGSAGSGAFVVATSNVGIGDLITASANTGPTALPLVLSICQTDPMTGLCITAIGASVTVQVNAAATPTFAIFATASAAIALDPAVNRIFVVFADAGNVIRGRTSVAVTTE